MWINKGRFTRLYINSLATDSEVVSWHTKGWKTLLRNEIEHENKLPSSGRILTWDFDSVPTKEWVDDF